MFHLSTDVSVLNDVSSHFQTGKAYHVTVLDSGHDDKLVLSMLGKRQCVCVSVFIEMLAEVKTLGEFFFLSCPVRELVLMDNN